jgi:hypothetical protein
MDLESAMKMEFENGLKTLESGEFIKGSKQFRKGMGKHGSFEG